MCKEILINGTPIENWHGYCPMAKEDWKELMLVSFSLSTNQVSTRLLDQASYPEKVKRAYHATIETDGYVHDVSIFVTLTPIKYGEEATGWGRAFESAKAKAQRHQLAMWKIANEDFAYSHRRY